MDKYTSPITDESFPEVWQHTARKYRRSKRGLVISRVVNPVGNIIFLFLSLMLSWKVLYELLPPMRSALELFPLLPRLWAGIPMLLAEQPWQVQLASALTICYGAAVLPCLLWTAVVYLLYHPIAPRKPDLGGALNATELRSLVLKARSCVNRSGSSMPTLSIAVYFAAVFCMLAVFVFRDPAGAAELVKLDPLSITIGGMGLFVGYALLNLLLQRLLRPMYLCIVPKRLLADIQHYYNSFDENIQADREADEIEALYKYAGR